MDAKAPKVLLLRDLLDIAELAKRLKHPESEVNHIPIGVYTCAIRRKQQ
jgi:hypothetical protein